MIPSIENKYLIPLIPFSFNLQEQAFAFQNQPAFSRPGVMYYFIVRQSFTVVIKEPPLYSELQGIAQGFQNWRGAG